MPADSCVAIHLFYLSIGRSPGKEAVIVREKYDNISAIETKLSSYLERLRCAYICALPNGIEMVAELGMNEYPCDSEWCSAWSFVVSCIIFLIPELYDQSQGGREDDGFKNRK